MIAIFDINAAMTSTLLRCFGGGKCRPHTSFFDRRAFPNVIPVNREVVFCQCARFGSKKIPLSRRKRPKRVRNAWAFVDEINNLEKHPIGSFEHQQFRLSKHAFNAFNWKYARDGGSVMKAIELLTRVVPELAACRDEVARVDTLEWAGNPNFLTELFFNWRFVYDRGYKVISPWDLAKKVQNLNAILPEFNISSKSIAYLVEATISSCKEWDTPIAAEKMLENYWLYSKILPNRSTLNKLIDAWARSRSDCAFEKVDFILKCMRDGAIMPNISSYNIVLRLSKDHEDISRLEKYMTVMQSEGIVPGHKAIHYSILCYARQYKMVKAVKMFDELADRQIDFIGEKDYDNIVSKSIEEIMYSFHKIVGDSMLSKEQRINALRSAENFVERYEDAKGVLDFHKRIGMLKAMMIMYDVAPGEDVYGPYKDYILPLD